MYLTKSDFTVARTCPTKLYYKKLRYPSLLEDDPYTRFLADGGYMVEKMAKLLYPDGRELGDWDNPKKAFAETKRAIQAGNCTLFEATIIHGNLLVRVDILQRFGKILRLIEVKSTSVDTSEDKENPFRGKKGGINADYRKYLEDVTFQKLVLQRAFPDFEIIPYLCVVDQAKTATENSTFDKFSLSRREGKQGKFRPQVDYHGDVAALAKEHILAILNVSSEVAELWDQVQSAADVLSASVQPEPIQKIAPEIGKKCKKCEYRMPLEQTEKNGFIECWGKLAAATPHILDLYRVDLLGGKITDLVAALTAAGRATLGDITDDMLVGKTAIRQRIQLESTAANNEFIDPELKDILRHHRYPLHFIDFEGSRLAIPYHPGMRPYEQAAFQFSCHTIHEPNGAIDHKYWLNADEVFPNFEFARELRRAIGDEGTVYIWSHYEGTTLEDIREQMGLYDEDDPALKRWLDRLIAKPNRRIADLCQMAKEYYCHPLMKGRLSIKYVLPAVWTTDRQLQEDPFFIRYVKRDPAGNLLNPYAALPPLPIRDGAEEEVVAEGTGAIRAYQEMMFGLSAADPIAKNNYRKLLLQYCELDTAAMVMVWKHWMREH